MSESPKETLHFFRIFDLAFFAPGATVFATLWWAGWINSESLQLQKTGGESATSVSLLLLAVLASYVFGLFCHACQRMVLTAKKNRSATESSEVSATPTAPWYTALSESSRHELALYFWYKRSTCWNMAIAMVLVGVIGLSKTRPCDWILWVGGCLIGSAAFGWLGNDFDRAMRGASKLQTPRPPNPLTSNPTPPTH